MSHILILMAVCAILPFCLTGGLITGATGLWRRLGVTATLIVPFVLYILFQTTVPAPSESDDGWGWAFALVLLSVLGAIWLTSALFGCLAGTLVLRFRARHNTAQP